MQKNSKCSAETREKMRQSAFTRDNRPRIAALPKGEQHWNWSNEPNKLAIHKRIHRKLGKASEYKCIDCGKTALDWSNNKGTKYSLDFSDYVPRCRSCHVKKDKNWTKK
jgi:DNA-directed RNA polymerase subunit RPC12/RpoP